MGALSDAVRSPAVSRASLVEVSFTCADVAEAETLMAALLTQRLAACAHHFPVTSTYWWHGQLERAEEELVTLTTRADRFAGIVDAVRRRHSYELPAITMRTVHEAAPGVAAWVDEALA